MQIEVNIKLTATESEIKEFVREQVNTFVADGIARIGDAASTVKFGDMGAGLTEILKKIIVPPSNPPSTASGSGEPA